MPIYDNSTTDAVLPQAFPPNTTGGVPQPIYVTTISDFNDANAAQACKAFTLAQAEALFAPRGPHLSLRLVKGVPHAEPPNNCELKSVESVSGIAVDFLSELPVMTTGTPPITSEGFTALNSPAEVKAAFPFVASSSVTSTSRTSSAFTRDTRSLLCNQPLSKRQAEQLCEQLEARITNTAIYINWGGSPIPTPGPSLTAEGVAAGLQWHEKLDGPPLGLATADLVGSAPQPPVQSTALVPMVVATQPPPSARPSTKQAAKAPPVYLELSTEEHLVVAEAIKLLADESGYLPAESSVGANAL